MGMIYKIFRMSEWEDFQTNGRTKGAPIDVQDGYIHFSSGAQVAETAAKHFAGETDLVLVTADPTALGDALKWETSRGGALFPHLYRELSAEDVVAAHMIGYDGSQHLFPDGVF